MNILQSRSGDIIPLSFLTFGDGCMERNMLINHGSKNCVVVVVVVDVVCLIPP